jgi:hypothetical protein
MFWTQDKVDNWRAKIFRDGKGKASRGTETVENMFSLKSTLHRFHSEGRFALRPVRMSADKTQLDLEFRWLAVQERATGVLVHLQEEPLSSRDRTHSGAGNAFFRLDDTDSPIRLVSGTAFTMTTENPTTHPLPDPGLMELQWHFQRIVAMSGAARWKEEDFDYDCDDVRVVGMTGFDTPRGLSVTE